MKSGRRWLVLFLMLPVVGCGGPDDSINTTTSKLNAGPTSVVPLFEMVGVFPDVVLADPIQGAQAIAIRKDDKAQVRISVPGLTEGYVYTLHFALFNHPEYCVYGYMAPFSPPVQCEALGPDVPLDAGNPLTEFSVVGFKGVKVGPDHRASWNVDFLHDTPAEILEGNNLTNPRGAQIFIVVVNKGPEQPAGPARDAQYNTVWAFTNTLTANGVFRPLQ